MRRRNVSLTEINDQVVGLNQLRNEPVQARSTARLAALLDAAADVIDEIGYERLTTAMVADRAGASIGTVYRYFPDRIAVLQALGARNLDRVLSAVNAAVRSDEHETWSDALSAGFDGFVEAFRSVPGFRALRVGDVIDLRPASADRTFNSIVAETLRESLEERFGIPKSDDVSFVFEVAIETCDSLVARAFARDVNGDARFVEAARACVLDRLTAALAAAE